MNSGVSRRSKIFERWIRLAACGWLLFTVVLFGGCCANAQEAQRATTHVVMIVDGLRPDYVTTELMPRLTSQGQRGVVFQAHHAVFPTVTRVNSASITTGAYPGTHGLMGNSIYIPRVDATRPLDTAARENLEAVVKNDGPLLTAPSLAQILRKSGRTVLVTSAGSAGSAFLLLPSELNARVSQRIGTAPLAATPNAPRNRYAADAYLRMGLEDFHPDVTFMWFGDPDPTGHPHGIGSEITRSALRLVDDEIGRIASPWSADAGDHDWSRDSRGITKRPSPIHCESPSCHRDSPNTRQ